MQIDAKELSVAIHDLKKAQAFIKEAKPKVAKRFAFKLIGRVIDEINKAIDKGGD